jgi:hypothetical protein
MPKENGLFLELLWRSNVFQTPVILEVKHSFELKLSGYHEDHGIYCWGIFQSEISYCILFPQYSALGWQFSDMAITQRTQSISRVVGTCRQETVYLVEWQKIREIVLSIGYKRKIESSELYDTIQSHFVLRVFFKTSSICWWLEQWLNFD